jgi:hypothetical protein
VRALLVVLVLLVGVPAVLVGWLWLRPNRARVDPRLRLEHWSAVADGVHPPTPT